MKYQQLIVVLLVLSLAPGVAGSAAADIKALLTGLGTATGPWT